uniref:Putative salivary gland metalloprotease n=1 Tax=Rhipicephalus microplus TaxID=6941 RepID=A0A6G5A788_RHIMP
MSVIRLLLYMILQLHHLECAKLPTREQIVFPEMLEGRSDNGDKVLRITGELTLNLEKSSILSKNFLLRTYEDSIMKHTYHDGEMLEEELYHDLKHLASVMVSEDDGLQVEGVLGPKLRIKPLVEDRKRKDALPMFSMKLMTTLLTTMQMLVLNGVNSSTFLDEMTKRVKIISKPVQSYWWL